MTQECEAFVRYHPYGGVKFGLVYGPTAKRVEKFACTLTEGSQDYEFSPVTFDPIDNEYAISFWLRHLEHGQHHAKEDGDNRAEDH